MEIECLEYKVIQYWEYRICQAAFQLKGGSQFKKLQRNGSRRLLFLCLGGDSATSRRDENYAAPRSFLFL